MDTFAALYVSLRNAVLGPHDTSVHHHGIGHFLTNGRYPVNMLQESSDLVDPAVPPAAGTPLAYGDNPLLNTGKLLIALAIESDVGSPTVTQWIDGALASLRSLFPFSGPFAGYPLRRDPVSSHDWSDQPVSWPMFAPPARYSANFLLDDAGQYQLLAPTHDWRRSRRIGPAEAAGLSSYALRVWGRRHKQDDMARLREMEPSSDELVGLITGLFFVWGFLPDPHRAAAAGILGELAEYLAEHSYFLVRPAGGFSSRGPATGSVAGEYASQRVFARILGDPHAARHDVPTMLASAGLWPSLEAGWNTDIVLDLAVVQPLLLALIEPLFGPLGALGLGAVNGAAGAFLQTLNEAGLNPVTLGGAWSLGRGNQLMFDCETRIAGDGVTVDEEYPLEIALGTLLNGVSAAARLQLYMGGWGAFSTAGWAVGFLPFLGLTALDDSDTLVRDNYLSMYRARTHANLGWERWLFNTAPRAAFPTAVALLLAADADPTSPEVRQLEAALVTELTSLHQYFDGLGEQPMTTSGMTEDANPALDYLVAVALAWLHRKRQGGRKVTVATPGFPQPPTPAELAAPQLTVTPKPPTPAPVPPADPPQLWHDTVTVQVGPRDGVVPTGVTVCPLDEIEITVTGQIDAGEVLDKASGPDGWDQIADSTDYPMTGGDARKYALVARLGQFGSFFPVGAHFPRRRFRYEVGAPLDLAVNTWNNGQGSGQFTAAIDRWSNIPAEGSLIQKTGDPTVYLVRHGRKSLLLTPGVLTILLGRGWNEVQQVDDAKLAQIDDGTPLVPFWVNPPPGPPPALWIGRFAGAATVLTPGDWAFQYWAGTYAEGVFNWTSVTGPAPDLFGNGLIWTGDFAGVGRTQILTYDSDQWTLGDLGADGQLTATPVGNTAGFGNLADGRPFWIGDFSGVGHAQVMFYFPGDENWWLGTVGGNGQLTWQPAGNTAGFGQVWDGRPFWIGDFSGVGHAQVMFYFPGDQNWWLGTVGGNGQLTWQPAGNTAAFGNLADGRPLHSGDFAGNGTASMLFFFGGDGNWFHGAMVNGQLAWSNVGNSKTNYDDTSVWQHHVGSFTAPGRDQVMICSLNDTQLATLNGTTLSWETIGGASDYGDLTRMSPRWYADFTGTGNTSVLFHAPEDRRWWLGTVGGDLSGARMQWNLVGEGVPMIVQGPG